MLYIIFYIVMRRNATYIANVKLLSICVCALMILLYVCRQPEWYIISLPAFVLGLWLPILENGLVQCRTYNLIRNKKSLLIIFILNGVVFIVTFRWDIVVRYVPACNRSVIYFFASFVYNFAFAVLSYILLSKTKFTIPTRALYITGAFYELYLLQKPAAIFVENTFSDRVVQYLAIFLIAIILAPILHSVNKALHGKIGSIGTLFKMNNPKND